MRHDDPEPKPRWGLMVGVSVGIHALILGGAVMLASGSGPRLTLYAPALSVSLVGPGDIGLPPGGEPAASPPLPKEPPKAEQKPAPKSEVSAVQPPKAKETPEIKTEKKAPPKRPPKAEKVVRVPKAAPAKKPEAPPKAAEKTRKETPRPSPPKQPPKKELTAQEADALARIRERILAHAGRPGADGPPGGPGGPGRGGGGLGVPGATGTGLNTYKNELARIFYAAWVLPRTLQREDLTATVVIHIDRSGQIVKTEVQKPSGDRYFDESVLRAVAKVQAGGGLPPLPPEIPGRVMIQGLLFDPKIHRGLSR
ncbi:MAG: TonB family protein [Candidatus Tectomicrobia bacterium]|nr:TonB family protein [Candidatus Tectomicrobia bacterium]